MNAMLKQLAPIAVIPPSPKKRAWMTMVIVIAIIADHGPRSTAMSVPPTGCPVEPPGNGMSKIIMINAKLALKARYGTCLAFNVFPTIREAIAHNGATVA